MSDSKERTPVSESRGDRPHLFMVLGLVVMIALTAFLFSLRRIDPLCGLWRLDSGTVYEFNGRGVGTLHASSRDYAFRYKLKDQLLSLDFKAEDARDTSYRVDVDGLTLIMKNNAGKAYRLSKTQ